MLKSVPKIKEGIIMEKILSISMYIICITCMSSVMAIDDTYTLDSENTFIITYPTAVGYIEDSDADGDGDIVTTTGDDLLVGEASDGKMYKASIKFDMPDIPSGKRLLAARLRVFVKSISSDFGKGLDLYTKMYDNANTSIAASIYESTANWWNCGILSYSDEAAGEWYEYRVQGFAYYDVTNQGSYRLELEDHAPASSERLYTISRTGDTQPQLRLVYSKEPESDTSCSITVSDTSMRNLRENPLLFGYNLNYYSFQGTYSYALNRLWDKDNQKVYDEAMEVLKRSPGMVYRYPGGSPANQWEWKNCIGAVAGREEYPVAYGVDMKVYFGLDEYVQFVKDVKGIPWLQVNVEPDPLAPDDTQDFEDLIEYCNLEVGDNPNGGTDWAQVREDNGFSEPFNIKYFELGNELDTGPDALTPQEYAAKVELYIAAAYDMDPSVILVPFAVSTPTSEFGYGNWHMPMLGDANIVDNAQFGGLAFHPYYHDNVTNWKQFNMDIIADLKEFGDSFSRDWSLYITESGKWSLESTPETTGEIGALNAVDFNLSMTPSGKVKSLMLHELGRAGEGGWAAFYQEDTESERLAQPRTEATEMYNAYLKGDILEVDVEATTDCALNTLLGFDAYDVRGSAMEDSLGKRLLVTNRYTGDKSVTIIDDDLSQGNLDIEMEIIRKFDSTSIIPGAMVRYTQVKTVSVDSSGSFTITVPARSFVAMKLYNNKNVIANPGFESGTSSWYCPVGTKTLKESQSDNVSGNYVNGSKDVQLQQNHNQNNDLDDDGYVGSNLNNIYLLTGTLRAVGCDSDKGINLTAYIRYDSAVLGGGYSTKKITGSHDWTKVYKYFAPIDMVPSGSSFDYMRIAIKGDATQGTVDFDEIALIKIPNLIINGNFETNVSNWQSDKGTRTYFSNGGKIGTGYMRVQGDSSGENYVAQIRQKKTDSFILARPNDYYTFRAYIRASSNLTGNGAYLQVNVWEEPIGGGTDTYAGGWTSNKGNTTDWTLCEIKLNPHEMLNQDKQLAAIDVTLKIDSNDGAGYVDFDGVNLSHLQYGQYGD